MVILSPSRMPMAFRARAPATLDYFQGSMYEAVEKIAEKYPDYIAYDFMGRSGHTDGDLIPFTDADGLQGTGAQVYLLHKLFVGGAAAHKVIKSNST